MLEVLRSGQLSLGPRVPAFEAAFAARVGARHACAVSSGTDRAAPRAAGGRRRRRRRGRHVAVLVRRLGQRAPLRGRPAGVRRHRPGHALPRPGRRRGRRSRTARRALLPVHIFGYPADVPALERHGLPIVEDACEALGAVHADGTPVGGRGHPAVFGFYANKQITTGEGGMVTLGSAEHKERDRLRAQPGPRARHGLARPRPARLQLPPVGHRLRARARPARAARRHARRARPRRRLVPRGARRPGGRARAGAAVRGLPAATGAAGSCSSSSCRDGVDRDATVRRAARARRAVQAVPAGDPPDVASTASASATARASSRSASASPRARSRCRSSRA